MLFYSVEDEEEGIIYQSLMIKLYNMERGGVLVGKVLKISAIIIDGSDFGRSHLYFMSGI